MKTKLNIIASAILLLLAPVAMAADVAIITLDNGTNVRLKDDFTWEYIITETVNQPAVAAQVTIATRPVDQQSVTASLITPPSVTTPAMPVAAVNDPASVAVVSSNMPATPVATLMQDNTRLTTAAMAQPELMATTAKDGIKITLTNSQWKDDQLGLVFDFTSTSSDHVTIVNVEASFYNDQGGLIKTEKLEAWEAIFRMPETYLRKGQQRQTMPIWVEGIDKQQWQKKLISLKIVEIESR